MRQDIEFHGFAGTALRGWLYLPAGPPARRPGVVMAHGFSALKEMALDRYAEIFCDAGFVVLVYDHRNLGASDGAKRQEINPWAQSRDYRYAVGWLAQRPEVDAERIGIWGSAFSGGEVIVVGACDRRVKAVVANVPFVGLPGTDYSNSADWCAAIRAALLDASGAGLADREVTVVGPMPVVRAPGFAGPVVLDQPESAEFFLRAAERLPAWVNRVTLVNGVGTTPAWDPGACVPHVTPTALLMVVASEDRLVEASVALSAFERAGVPKELVLVDGDHFAVYEGEGFKRAAEAARRFFVRQLQA